ncbi:hypothetical protein [Ensifer aridi]|uniref:hypothetical protein n=1 Tax=Ensifer aridi TaxID=1708715 RepID=UPI001124F10B|nr:hypothetical protein [Ensifer aridi]
MEIHRTDRPTAEMRVKANTDKCALSGYATSVHQPSRRYRKHSRSGALLSRLLAEGLITVPWISMSRLFLGTEQFFYSNRKSMRRVPPELTHATSGVVYDRNVVRVPRREIGAYHVDESGIGSLA